MMTYRLSPAAEADLDDIWIYTVRKWSADQGDSYISSLFDAFAKLGQNPGMGRRVDTLMAGYRQFRCGHHLIFYVEAHEGKIEVIRVLHEKVDALRHLGSSPL